MDHHLLVPPARSAHETLPARGYVGERGPAGCRVWAVREHGSEPLAARASAPSWSFAWGRFGTSARALAWALIHDVSGDEGLADDWCGDLCAEVISRLPHEAFELPASDLVLWLDVTAATPSAVGA